MRDYIVKLTTDLAQSTEKTRFWSAEAKQRAAQHGLASDCYKQAARLLSVWSNDMERLQEELDAEADGQEIAYNTEYAKVD